MKGSDYAELTVFLAVAEERNFRRAATRLGLSPSAVSHSIRALETRLQVRLFNRTTRSISPTESGISLLSRLGPAISALENAVEAIGDQLTPRGTLRINMPRLAGHLVMLPQLTRFITCYPDIRLDLAIEDHLQDVVGTGYDAGIRTRDRVPKDMIAVRVSPDLKMVIVAAPEYLDTFPAPQTPDELSPHRIVNYRWSENGAQYRWLLQRASETLEAPVTPVMTVNDINMLLIAAEQGAGLALLEEHQVSSALSAGRLVRVLPEWHQPVNGFHLYYPRNAFMTPAMRALVDFLRVAP